jgi:hypothetical protein
VRSITEDEEYLFPQQAKILPERLQIKNFPTAT